MTNNANPAGTVDVVIDRNPPLQSRWSVLFRLLPTVPLDVVLAALSLVATAVVIVAWFAALVTTRVPQRRH